MTAIYDRLQEPINSVPSIGTESYFRVRYWQDLIVDHIVQFGSLDTEMFTVDIQKLDTDDRTYAALAFWDLLDIRVLGWDVNRTNASLN